MPDSGQSSAAAESSGNAAIHIVGLYKCGTSWLLHMLAAHPDVAAWREFDPLRACYTPERRLHNLPLAVSDYLRPRPADPAWMGRREAARPRPQAEIFREMFLGRGWIPVMGAARQREAALLATNELEQTLDQLLALGNFRVRRSDGPLIRPGNHSNTLGVMNFRRNDLLHLMRAVRDAADAQAIPAIFYDSLHSQVSKGTTIACKAADQIMLFSNLRQASPGARTLAIVRDGRDATISARHFEALMRRREAPWRTAKASSLRRLLGWSVRAAKLAEHARRGEITVVRYEDLRRDFSPICTALFEHLGLGASDSIVEQVRHTTDFKTVTDGRMPGETADHVIRKGAIGEWQHTLSDREARLAWRLAGDSLSAFGYSRDGTLRASPLVLSPRENIGERVIRQAVMYHGPF